MLRSRTTAISDFHVGEAISRIHLDVLVPLSVRRDGGSALIGVILVRVDPSHELHPIIQSWPTPSPTAETLLVRREGSDVIYLNELRHRKESALSMRLPLTRKEVPAVQAVLGHRGNFQGKDYRDVQVLSVTRKIPGTPWFLVAKVDSAEIIAPVRREAWVAGAFSVLLILLAGACVGLFWRHSSAKFYKRLYREEHAKSLLAEHVERLNRMYLTLNSANQAIVRCRDRQTLFDELCRIVVENGGFRMAWVGVHVFRVP